MLLFVLFLVPSVQPVPQQADEVKVKPNLMKRLSLIFAFSKISFDKGAWIVRDQNSYFLLFSIYASQWCFYFLRTLFIKTDELFSICVSRWYWAQRVSLRHLDQMELLTRERLKGGLLGVSLLQLTARGEKTAVVVCLSSLCNTFVFPPSWCAIFGLWESHRNWNGEQRLGDQLMCCRCAECWTEDSIGEENPANLATAKKFFFTLFW